MELQKRSGSQRRTPRQKENPQDDSRDDQSASVGSVRSRESSAKITKPSTRLAPLGPEYRTTKTDAVYGGQTDTRRRNSSGVIGVNGLPQDMIPFDLTKKPIKPTDVPLAAKHIALPIFASTENELIVNKFESSEEKKDPDSQWAKVNKYTCYDARGFGTFNPKLGRGVCGVELQKALRRQANGLKHTLWELKIRAPYFE